jgi:hypothetical protein
MFSGAIYNVAFKSLIKNIRDFLGTEFEITKNQKVVFAFGLREPILNQSNYIIRLNYKASL